ncbi:MAG TPA: hypothetical protein DIW23_01740 [Anaerolineae bacterium]|nr:hypothetical protein [Anaerolineae bacterium]
MSPERQKPNISFEEVVSQAKETILRMGNHVPALIVEGDKKLVYGEILDLPPTHGERMNLLRFLGQTSAKSAVIGKLNKAYMVTEGWMSTVGEDKPSNLRPSQDPEKKEVLIISGIEIQDNKKRIMVYEIIRNKNKKIDHLEELFSDTDNEKMAESPLLDAFVDGFQNAFRARYN